MSFLQNVLWTVGALSVVAVASADEPAIRWDGGIATYYQYQFNNPTNTNHLTGRGFESLHNTPTLDLFEINVGKLATKKGFGFQTSWIGGNLADELHYTSGSSGAGEARFKSLGQVYGIYQPPCGHDLWFGKFYSPFGIEQVEPWKNPFLSHSNVYEALPHYNFGVGIPDYPVGSSGFHLKGFVVNSLFNGPNLGVQDNDNNKDLIFGGQYIPSGGWMMPRMGLTFGSGKEKDLSGTDKRCLTDFTLHYDQRRSGVWDFEYLYGTQKPTGSSASLSEVKTSGYNLNYTYPLDQGMTHLRYDRLDTKASGTTNWRSSISANYDHKLDMNTTFRLEYRHDMSNQGLYLGSGSVLGQKNQDTFSIGLMRSIFCP